MAPKHAKLDMASSSFEKELTGALCRVCPQMCFISEGQRGFCQARSNVGGAVCDENYGRITSIALDPIEKKPLARFHRGSKILSVGSYGCNMRCSFCQNAMISCANAEEVRWEYVGPDELVDTALKLKPQGNIGIAFTYNEPVVGYEYVRDTCRKAHQTDLLTVLVSNGCMSASTLHELAPVLDAANIDLKGFNQDFYAEFDGNFGAVLRTVKTLANTQTCHLEVTTLIIPGLNDSPAEVSKAAAWLASIDPEIPYHITRFFPTHRMTDRPATSIAKIHELADIARRHLKYVYVGNC